MHTRTGAMVTFVIDNLLAKGVAGGEQHPLYPPEQHNVIAVQLEQTTGFTLHRAHTTMDTLTSDSHATVVFTHREINRWKVTVC